MEVELAVQVHGGGVWDNSSVSAHLEVIDNYCDGDRGFVNGINCMSGLEEGVNSGWE